MVQRTRLLECPNCHKQLEDTKQPTITCKFCGFPFNREEVAQEDEDYIRRKMIIELRTDMEVYKSRKKFSIGFMIAAFILVVPAILAAPSTALTIAISIAFALLGFGFFLFMIMWDRRYESARSRASDISMRRRL
ncbi:MAG: hypothetical protein R6V01_08690 [Thermoplasmatota archaeon]